MSAFLRRIAFLVLGGCAVWASAAELRGDRVFLCDAPRDASESMRPSALMLQAGAALGRQAYVEAFEAMAATYERTLTPTLLQRQDVRTFLDALRGASGEAVGTFQVSPVVIGARNAEALFATTAVKIEFECRTLAQFQVDMASAALVTDAILARKMIPEFAKRASAVSAQYRRHENLVRNGLPMWPWELWLNGKRLGEGDASPLFRRQIVLMRPSAGVEINTRNRQSADMDASLALEPLGFVQYTEDDYSSWWGLSAVLTTTTGSGLGYGVLLRYENYSLGITRHESEVPGASDDTYLMLSIDLYDLLQKKRAELPAFKERVREQALDLLTQ